MENTNYSEIIELVLILISDYKIDEIFESYDERGLLQLLTPYFKKANGEIAIKSPSLNITRDDDLQEFNRQLTDAEQLIFAKEILIAYLTKEVNDILQMQLHLQDGDFKTHAAKNNLEAKSSLLETLKEETGWNITKTGYNSMNIWG